MSKQTFSIFQIFALYFPFCMRPYDARSSVTLEKLGFVVREPQSHLELTYFLPKISAFMLISGNWASIYTCNVCPRTYHKYTKVIYMVSIPVMSVPVQTQNCGQ